MMLHKNFHMLNAHKLRQYGHTSTSTGCVILNPLVVTVTQAGAFYDSFAVVNNEATLQSQSKQMSNIK